MRKINITVIGLLVVFSFSQCNQPANNKVGVKPPIERKKPVNTGFHFEKTKEWIMKDSSDPRQNIVLAVNRTDKNNLIKMDSIIVPNDLTGDLAFYLPFPLSVPYLKDISKIIFFSYPTQSFAAYENGELVYTGPVNMGRKADPTPTGLYYTNWKAEQTTSTFNDEWDLRWNFNIENKLGIGFHQYELPGYPASHSCLRLLEKDARYLYDWADQWILEKQDSIRAKGTPVIVFGTYPFGEAKPWFQLVNDPHIHDIPGSQLEQQTAPFLADIMTQQQRRATVDVGKE